ncbi:MAG: hypothetical protein GY792_18900, partial [Gammaproteobacteria bacterium]|nr:hypothetical protein [Gammaproteobacteria bacterium]
RGGSWNDLPEFARPAYRGGFQPSSTFNITGFRCASSSEITPEPTPTPDITNVALRINSSVFSVAWSSDGNLLAAGTIDDNVYIWDAVNQETWRILGPHEYGVRDLAYSPNGQFLASGSFNSGMKSGTIEIWRATSGVQLETLHGFFGAVGGVAWSPDSRYLAGGSSNG